MLLKNLYYSKSQLLNLSSVSLILFFTIFNGNAQTVTCPAETNIGTLHCYDIGDSRVPQIQEIPTLEEIMLPPYNMEITGILPETAMVTEDSDVISFCPSGASEITRLITIYNDANLNFGYDAGEELGFCTFIINIEPDLEPPQFFAPQDIEINCALDLPESFFIQMSLIGDDNCPGYTEEYVEYSEEVLNTTGICPEDGVIFVRSWTTADLCGNRRDHTQTVTIKDGTGPDFIVPANITVPCGTNLMDTILTGNASNGFDQCEGIEVAVVATIIEHLTEENTPCVGATTYTKRWKAVDSCNNATTKDQFIVVDCDSNCPNFTTSITCPAETDLSINCKDIGDPGIQQLQIVPTLEEVMMPPYNIEISGILSETAIYVDDSSVLSFCITDRRRINRTITIYNDENSNFIYDSGEEIGTCTFTIFSEPIGEIPQFTAPPNIETNCELGTSVEVTGEPQLSSDACPLSSFTMVFTDNYATPICKGGGNILSRRWVLYDGCGNASEAQTQTIIITGTPPEFTVPEDITIFCGTDPMDVSITGDVTDGTDECGSFEVDVVSVIVDDLTQEDSPCAGTTTYTKRWAAVDGCGAATIKDQIIVVECPPDCSNQDICVGDILADPLPGECDCQVVEEQVLGCTDLLSINYDPAVNCDDGTCLINFDLALVKEISSAGPFSTGNNASISFKITVYNQGDLTAQNIEIIDYIPLSLTLNDTNWTQSGANVVTTIVDPLEPGELVSVDINFIIDSQATAGTYTNFAEIFGAQDILGNSGQDSDSTPDTNNGNDNVNSPLYYVDEDDHDGAEFTIVDNSLCPNNNNAGYFCE